MHVLPHAARRLGTVAAAVTLALVAAGPMARAAIDNTQSAGTIPYNGTLYSGGQPVDGQVDFCFRLFNGTTAIWAEKQTATVTASQFAVRLGSVTPLPDAAATDTDLYLEISVVAHPAAGPRTCDTTDPVSTDYTTLGNRQRLGTVAYALRAVNAVSAGSANTAGSATTAARLTDMHIVTLTSSSGTWTVPNGVTQIKVTVKGGGGGGANFVPGTSTEGTGGGGGEGGTTIMIMQVTPNSGIPYSVGGGGGANAPGGNSTFNGITGGGGSPGNTGNDVNGLSCNPGQGGAGGGAWGGTVNMPGAPGQMGSTESGMGGSGGGAGAGIGGWVDINGGNHGPSGGAANSGGGGGGGSVFAMAGAGGGSGIIIIEY